MLTGSPPADPPSSPHTGAPARQRGIAVGCATLIALLLACIPVQVPAMAPPEAQVAAPDTTPPDSRRAESLRALAAGTLDPAIDARTLFDIPVDDPDAVALEAARLKVLLGSPDAAGQVPVGQQCVNGHGLHAIFGGFGLCP
jgi:hypothetical protein